MNKFLIVGLGNIGQEYAHTRHNIGFDVADAFVSKHSAIFKSSRLATVAEIKWKGKIFICIKPSTYMNESGKAFKYWMDKENIALENTLTIVDEIAIPLNKIRFRPGGNDGGHKGLKNIQFAIGTAQYPKLRFGIGNNYPKGRQIDYVLSKWFTEEVDFINRKINACTEIIESFAAVGIEKTMNLFNNKIFV